MHILIPKGHQKVLKGEITCNIREDNSNHDLCEQEINTHAVLFKQMKILTVRCCSRAMKSIRFYSCLRLTKTIRYI